MYATEILHDKLSFFLEAIMFSAICLAQILPVFTPHGALSTVLFVELSRLFNCRNHKLMNHSRAIDADNTESIDLVLVVRIRKGDIGMKY